MPRGKALKPGGGGLQFGGGGLGGPPGFMFPKFGGG